MNDHGLSARGWANVAEVIPRISAAIEERSRQDNPNIDLSTAENWLIRTEMMEICKEAVENNLRAKHLSYPSAFGGDSDVLAAFAGFFNSYFNPTMAVKPAHIATVPGAAAGLDALLYNICDPGDGVLVPGPYWNAFDFLFHSRSSVTPIAVTLPQIELVLTEALIAALEEAFQSATRPIKAVVLTNPHNPLGLCYTPSVIESCLKFCHKHSIHFISDEIYALTSYRNPDIATPVTFVSVLSLDVVALGIDGSRVHVIWSTSKDFGQSGVRMGCVVTQANKELAAGVVLASNTQTSSLSALFVTALLNSPKLPTLIALNSERLANNYQILTSFLVRKKIPYIPSNAGLYVFAKIAPEAQEWEDEQLMLRRFKDVGVVVSAGRGYHVAETEKGWARVGFAVESDRLQEALTRMSSVINIGK